MLKMSVADKAKLRDEFYREIMAGVAELGNLEYLNQTDGLVVQTNFGKYGRQDVVIKVVIKNELVDVEGIRQDMAIKEAEAKRAKEAKEKKRKADQVKREKAKTAKTEKESQ